MSKRQLVLRCSGPGGISRNGFQWPLEVGAVVTAPDWKPVESCGNGLHGWLFGVGDVGASEWRAHADAVWHVVEPIGRIVDLGGKVKFESCTVLFVGARVDAVAWLQGQPESDGVAVIYGTATAGNRGTATAGYMGTATAGDSGTATAGYRGTATAGDRGTATAGDMGTATAGDMGTATAGDSGTATAGNRGTATAGDSGTATAGNRGTATAGDSGTATAGDMGTATAGEGGVIVIERWTGVVYEREIAKVGRNGIQPNKPYRLDDEGNFAQAILIKQESRCVVP